ncbi:MAG: hypothetical protein A3J83_04715 [Elusimicrobia bacterium RIFOXYA2_FULL_40_6]|nr:MAG: hypothetical protein A3J83_04715 [Elusimicrobia bacterium RIFOXYA2_FULL_40_6]
MESKAKILVIDDEKGIQDLFRFLLEPEGYTIVIANDGVEGVDAVKKEEFDVVFLDVHMPKMKGPEALKIIKQLRPDQKVIVFSSSSDSNHAFENEAKQLGAFACIYKPSGIEEILRLVREASGNMGY